MLSRKINKINPFVHDHPETTGKLIDKKMLLKSHRRENCGLEGLVKAFLRWARMCRDLSISLTCAVLDANWVDGSSELQTGHQLIGLFGLLGLALVVAAVDATTGRVTPEVRPPRSRGTITCSGATTTSHSTCLKYN